MEAIILAGGMGTRLKDVIPSIPKPMAPVAGKPFLYYIFDWIREYPIDRIILSVGYKAESISKYFGNSVFDIPVEYVVEKKPLGTGGALKLASERAEGNNILIVNGDTWFPVDISKLTAFHIEIDSKFTVALKRMTDFDRYGTVELDNNRILRFNEKRYCSEGLINGGIYIAKRRFIKSWQMPDKFSLEKDILEKEAGKSILKGIVFDEPFLDIGVPEDYMRAESIIRTGT
ncbi:MAG TPA: nucleotidyltransferase family protein [Bacteroidales bacterium]|nr:nucleotidyltransferase family protein [Bacteroidales bacterium]HPM88114.1 nucleotidyltransferase family protein [Bacteroidales bacterium]